MGWIVAVLMVIIILLVFMCVEDSGKGEKHPTWPNYVVSLIAMFGLLILWLFLKGFI